MLYPLTTYDQIATSTYRVQLPFYSLFQLKQRAERFTALRGWFWLLKPILIDLINALGYDEVPPESCSRHEDPALRFLPVWLAVVFCLPVCLHAAEPDASASPPSFNDDVIPVLTRFGCNMGACHGKLAGQTGFKLSLRGFAPEADFESITREGRGRRISPGSPEQSLLIKKAVGAVPHGGGQRFAEDSPAAKVLADWIRAGMPGPKNDEPALVAVEISPNQQQMKVEDKAKLLVTATYADGRKRDVTWLTAFVARPKTSAPFVQFAMVRRPVADPMFPRRK